MNETDIRLEARADPKLLRAVRGLIRCYLIAQGFAEERADEVVLAVDEACTNAIRHSYGGCCDETLELQLAASPEGLEICLSDRGTPAPEHALVRKGFPRPDIATLKPGGLGVQLMFEVFDEVEFRPGPECGNTVRMLLRWPDGRAGATAREGDAR